MSIQKRGQSYVARWRRDGHQHARSFSRKADAEAFELEQRRAAQLGAHAPAVPTRLVLRDYLAEWWASESPLWQPSTRVQRRQVLDRWVKPTLGGVRLSDLGSKRIREWRGELTASGCAATQANQALSVLSAALGCAARDGRLPANPALGIRKLPVRVVRPRALAPLEVEQLLVAVPTIRDRVAIALMAYSGLRPEEMLALRWDDVLDHVIVVDRAFTYGALKALKAGTRRTVEIVQPLRDDLEEFRPARTAPGALVVPSASNSYLDLHNWRRRVWHEARKTAGIAPAVPNDCRHTYASLLIHEGRSLPYVTAALGHASATTSLSHYVHLFEEQRLGTAVGMVDAITDARRRVRKTCAPSAPRRLRQAAPRV